MAATAHWTAAADFPAHGSPRDKLGFAVKVATIISTGQQQVQPWQFHLADQFVELSADIPSAAPVFDPDEREAMIHCGTALQHLKLALKRHRCFGRVELFPNLDQPTLAARVHPGSNGVRDDYERQLSETLEVGETDSLRRKPPDNAVTLDVVSRAMPGDRGWLEFARSDNSRQRLLELLNSPGRAQLKEIRLPNETLVQSIDGAWESTRVTGTTLHERFSRWRRPTLAVKVQVKAPASRATPALTDPIATSGTFAVLKTKTDDKHGWLAAGQMLARLLLHARTLGLACTPFLDVLQRPELRSELRTAIGHKGFTQVILRFAGLQMEPPLPSFARYPTTTTGSSI